ncbi:MAG: hypothetical protein ACRD01_05000 [Terriglobales bacterium]
MKRIALTLSLLLLAVGAFALGQQAGPTDTAAVTSYRVRLFLTTTPQGEAASTQQYQLLAGRKSSNTIETKANVPVPIEGGQRNQLVETDVMCSLVGEHDPAGEVTLMVRVNVTGAPGKGTAAGAKLDSARVVLTTVVPLGRRVTISSFEDATTHTAFQLAAEAEPAARN